MTTRLSPSAAVDISDLLKRTGREYGRRARERYSELIRQALKDVSHAQIPLTDILTCEEGEVFVYLLSRSRLRVNPVSNRVKKPRHLLLCRRCADGMVEVVRVLHDRNDIEERFSDGSDR